MHFIADMVFFISEGWLNFTRSKGTTFISIFIISISIAIITIFSTFFVSIDSFLNEMKNTPIVSIYLKQNVDKRDVALLGNKLSLVKGVKDFKVISPKMGLTMLYKRFSYLKGSEGELGDNPLPYSFVFRIDFNKLQQIRKLISNYRDIVDEMYTPFDLFVKVEEVAGGFSLFATILTLVLIISSIITIYNVIRITIVSRKEDIAIMQLVGASLKYIRMPFIVEGILQGFFGGLFGLILGNIAIFYINRYYIMKIEALKLISNISILSLNMQLKIALLSLVFGVLGSLIASLQIDYT